jgi:hypothetical protein
MNNRKITLLSLAVSLLCLVLSYIVMPPPESWRKVTPGMSEAELISLLGQPTGGLGEKAIGVWHQRGHKLRVYLGTDPNGNGVVLMRFSTHRSLPIWFLKLTDQSLW